MANVIFSNLDLNTGKEILSTISGIFNGIFQNDFTVHGTAILARMKKNYRLSRPDTPRFTLVVSSDFHLPSTLRAALEDFCAFEVSNENELDYQPQYAD